MSDLPTPNYDPNNPHCNTGPSIRTVLENLGPRTIEGDQGRYVSHSVDDAIKAYEFDRRLKMASTKGFARRVLSSITSRLASHDGRGS